MDPMDRVVYLDSRGFNLILGGAYILVGLGVFYSLATGRIELLSAVLIGVLGLILLSLLVIVRREGLVTPENKLIVACVAIAMGLLFGLQSFSRLSSEAIFGIVFVVGVLVPHLLIEYTSIGAHGKPR